MRTSLIIDYGCKMADGAAVDGCGHGAAPVSGGARAVRGTKLED